MTTKMSQLQARIDSAERMKTTPESDPPCDMFAVAWANAKEGEPLKFFPDSWLSLSHEEIREKWRLLQLERIAAARS